MADELLKHLYDIREATAAIFRFVRSKTFDDYEQDELLRSGIEQKFEIIGEALNRIRRDAPALLDNIREHRHIVSFRNILTATTALTTGSCGASSKKIWQTTRKCREIERSCGREGRSTRTALTGTNRSSVIAHTGRVGKESGMRARLIGCLLVLSASGPPGGPRKWACARRSRAVSQPRPCSPACRRTPRYSRFLDQGRRDVRQACRH